MFEAAGLVVVVELVVVVPLLFVVEVEFVVDIVVLVFVIAGEGDAAGVLAFIVFAGLLAAEFVLAASPQAIPKALRANTDESAITFFITNSSLLSSSKSKTNLFISYHYASAVCLNLKDFLKQTSI